MRSPRSMYRPSPSSLSPALGLVFALACAGSGLAFAGVVPASAPDAQGAAAEGGEDGQRATPTDAGALVDEAAPAADDGEKLSVIVPRFQKVGEVSQAELDTITGLVVYQVTKVKRLEVVSESDIEEMLALEAKKAAMGCSEEDSCINEIADALGADLILAGKVGRLGQRYLVNLTLIDTAQAKPVARAQLQVRTMNQIGGELILAIDSLTKAYGGLPKIEEQKKALAEAESRTSYAGRFVDFATQPDTVMLFATFAGGLFALFPPLLWLAPIVQGVILWWLGDDIAGREYPRWWLAIPVGWAVYLAAFLVAAVASAAGAVSANVAGSLGITGGGGIAVTGTSAAILMVFLLEPVVVWWVATGGARDVDVFGMSDDMEGDAPGAPRNGSDPQPARPANEDESATDERDDSAEATDEAADGSGGQADEELYERPDRPGSSSTEDADELYNTPDDGARAGLGVPSVQQVVVAVQRAATWARVDQR